MSCQHHKPTATEALASYTRDSPGGPTQTTTTQRQFAQRLRGALARIKSVIREAVRSRDLFNLTSEALVDDIPERVFQTRSTRRTAQAFLAWLRQQLDTEYLGIVGPDRNEFIRQAYAAGIRKANSDLRDLDVSFVVRDSVDDLLQQAFHQSELRTLYERTYENLESVAEDVATEVRDVLVDGFSQGASPTKIARDINDRIDSIGKHRSTLIARSEVMNAHSTGTLNRLEEADEDTTEGLGVVHGEWQTAADSDVCAFCRRLGGTELTTSEMAGTRVEFRGSVYRLKPPAHPQGRCAILPSVGRPSGPLDERLPDSFTVLA